MNLMKIDKRKIIRYMRILVFLLIITLFYSCKSFGYDFELSYTSPQGTNSIVVKYDLVSRPTIFKRGFLWDKKIWEYPNSGFMETVTFDVEWLSENKIRFTYDNVHDKYDEQYIIVIPD